ncbi:MAG: hypothetical protein HWD60_17830 [Defluviicoccus sp.]|nr:MAG: hypothetical protein HWD60_17830 [Defluviicoccus sp.]
MYGAPEKHETEADTAEAVTSDLSSIRVGLIPGRNGQRLRNQLEFLLDPNASPSARRYTLNVKLSDREDSLALERSGFATRGNVEMTATFSLIDDATGSTTLTSTSRAVSGFNLLTNDFSTMVARGDAFTRVVDQLAYEIRNRLAAHFTAQARAASADPS